METRRIGRSGCRVTRLGLGTMTFGLQADERESHAMMDYAYERGVRFFDIADVYPVGGDLSTVGRSEEIVGRWLANRRDDAIIATKCYFPTGPQPWQRGLSRDHILRSVDASLGRLGTDYIDLYQFHLWDDETPLEESLETLQILLDAGKIRYVGVSNWQAWQVALAIGAADAGAFPRMVSSQSRYNLLFREFERDLFPLARHSDVGVVAYNPLGGGMLTGRYRRDQAVSPNTRFALGASIGSLYQERYWHEQAFSAVERIEELAHQAGMDLATLAVAWVLHEPTVSCALVGASRPDQLDATLRAVDVKLDDDLARLLDEATREFRLGDTGR